MKSKQKSFVWQRVHPCDPYQTGGIHAAVTIVNISKKLI